MSERRTVQISKTSWKMLTVLKLVTGNSITAIIDQLVEKLTKETPAVYAIYKSTLVDERRLFKSLGDKKEQNTETIITNKKKVRSMEN